MLMMIVLNIAGCYPDHVGIMGSGNRAGCSVREGSLKSAREEGAGVRHR